MENKFYNITARTSDEAEILLYGDIGGDWLTGGTGAQEFVDNLKALGNVKKLSVRINSPGGDAFDGLAIFNALDRFPARKTVYIDALAASAASIIAMAGDTIEIAENGILMIHNPQGVAAGDWQVLEEVMKALNTTKEVMVATYRRKSFLPSEKISEMMDEETWMGASDALKNGFVTQIGKPVALTASLNLDFSHYKRPAGDIQKLLSALGNVTPSPEEKKLFERFDEVKKKAGTSPLSEEEASLFRRVDEAKKKAGLI